jgi:hypothetical protein
MVMARPVGSRSPLTMASIAQRLEARAEVGHDPVAAVGDGLQELAHGELLLSSYRDMSASSKATCSGVGLGPNPLAGHLRRARSAASAQTGVPALPPCAVTVTLDPDEAEATD